MSAGVTTAPGRYILLPMPTGTVWIERGADGRLQARVEVFGLTPGSSHRVSLAGQFGHPVQFPALTANAAGQANVTLTSVDRVAAPPPASRFVILLGNGGGDPLAAEPIAETGTVYSGLGLALHAVVTEGDGLAWPAGQATLTYNTTAHTLTITVTASGLTPGPHAAHVHLGSCQNQGPVKYMMADFIADAQGDIVHQTRVVTGVTGVPGAGSWYLNLHQGSMQQILSGGTPTLLFRPMLCTDLTSFAVTGGAPAPAVTPTASPTGSTPAAVMPSSTPATVTPASSPSPSPSTSPHPSPTHW